MLFIVNTRKRKILLEELYGRVSSLTYEDWLEAKRQNNVKESINYWMSRCASLQQEIDALNEKLANVNDIKWQTGIPNSSGRYLVTYRLLKTGEVDVNALDWFSSHGDWFGGKYLEVIAWCKLSDIQPYKGKEGRNEH